MIRNLLRSLAKKSRPSVINVRCYAAAAKDECQPATKKEGPPPKKAHDRRIFKIYRYGGIKSKEAPSVQSYELDVNTCGKMLLDVLIKLKEMDPTLTFRRSCREGICGSCGICLQGSNCLACITKVPDDKTITVYPLPHMYVQRDLVVDMTHFLNSYDSIKPYLIRKVANSPLGSQQYAQSIPDSLKFNGLYECILCGCCSTACPSYWWNGRRFLGPASLLHAYRWVIDSRDEDHDNRLYELRDDFQAFRCHAILNCSLVCPKHLRPGKAIAKLKRLIVGLDKKPRSEMDPMGFSSGSNLKECTARTKLPKELKKLLVPKIQPMSTGSSDPCKSSPKPKRGGYPCDSKKASSDTMSKSSSMDPCGIRTEYKNPCKIENLAKDDDPCKKYKKKEKKHNDDPCKKYRKKEDDPCKKRDEDPCKKKDENPCKKQEDDDPCKKYRK